MSWVRVKLPGGTLRIKPSWQARSFEKEKRVPTLRLGPFLVSFWSKDQEHRYRANY